MSDDTAAWADEPRTPEPLIDPDCRAGKHLSCTGGDCECGCHHAVRYEQHPDWASLRPDGVDEPAAAAKDASTQADVEAALPTQPPQPPPPNIDDDDHPGRHARPGRAQRAATIQALGQLEVARFEAACARVENWSDNVRVWLAIMQERLRHQAAHADDRVLLGLIAAFDRRPA